MAMAATHAPVDDGAVSAGGLPLVRRHPIPEDGVVAAFLDFETITAERRGASNLTQP